MDDGKHAFRTRQGGLQPLGAVAAPQGETRPVRLTNRLRNLAAGALASHLILSDNVTERASPHERYSGKRLRPWPRCCNSGCRRKPMIMCGVCWRGLARLQLTQPEASARLAAVTLLGHSADPETRALLIPLPMPSMSRMRRCARRPATACKRSNIVCCSAICWASLYGAVAGLGAAAGRAGAGDHPWPAGVINMAHGEMLMIGAYSCWLVQQALAQLAPQWLAFYPLVALPVAFLVTAGIGMALERTIIRHLYGRPLETLLATGISLMLIQLVRMLFGAQNVEVANPARLRRRAGPAEPDPAVEPAGGTGWRSSCWCCAYLGSS